MKSQFRTALMWLLLLALPLQGFAAATMLNCGPNHHRMLSATPVKAPSVADVDAKVGHHGHVMGMAGDHHDMVADAGSNDMPSVHHLDKLTKFKCIACAACCLGAALPTAPLVFTSFPPAMTTAAFVSNPHADFLSGGLDRPPRLPLV